MTKAEMLDLTEQVTASLKNLNAYPWFPNLTDGLAKMGWRGLERDVGLTPLSYGTTRVLAGNVNAPRIVITPLPDLLAPESFKATVPIEFLPRDIAHHYEDMGVYLYAEEEITGTNIISCFENAFRILKQVPTMLTTIATLVRSIHVIKPETDDYDVSFSDPHIPFSIFISVPQKCSRINHLRITEAIVHEAMHLQLTFIEKIVPIVLASTSKYFSPWKQEHRTSHGILHAVYVFWVIDKFLEIISSLPQCTKEEMAYIRARRTEISEEMNQVQVFINCPDLTSTGHSFVQHILFDK